MWSLSALCLIFLTVSTVYGQDNTTNNNNANTNNANTNSNNNIETFVKNAAFEDVAPCPCDLTRGACDIGCCCDGSCSADEKLTFDRCIPYLEGGQDAQTQQYKCASNHYNKPDWFSFTCVVFEYNAFLGYFYDWQYKLANNTRAFLNKLSTASFYWYREEERRGLSETANVYKYGVSVKTLQSNTGRKGYLTLPQPILSGQCLSTAPVQYLKNLDHSCTYTVTAAQCGSDSVLSSLFYIQSSSINTNNFFNIQEQNSDTTVAVTNVVYKCAGAAYLQSYLKSTQTLSNIVQDGVVYKFNYVLPADPNCIDACGNDTCIDLDNLPNPDVTPPSTSSLPDCASQNPVVPTVVGGVCTNAVIDVDYTIRWAGNKIAQLDAIIVLADITLQNELSQKYRTTFTHNTTDVGNASTDNFLNITDAAYERSGRVGYNISKPIHTGSEVFNQSVTPPQFMYVNTNTTRQMAVFNPSADGLCFNAGRRLINFGEDVTTQCKLMLNITEFSDCSGLRKLIRNRLNALMPSDLIGRRGYNDPVNRGYWLNVLRDDLYTECILSDYFPVGSSPIDNRTGICFNVTSGIHLEIFYGITGKAYNESIYEILGAKVSYSNSTWKVSCFGPSGSTCTGSSTQPFYLTSSVHFTEIPPQVQEPVAKYYEIPREEDKELCPGDRCWDNLFYPFTHRFKSESREYVFGMVSLSIIFFSGYLLVSRPFW